MFCLTNKENKEKEVRQEPQRNLRTPFVNSGFEGFSFFEGAEIGAECQECFCFLLTIIGKNNNAS